MSLYFYNENENNKKEESINNYAFIFREFTKKVPNLKNALKQLFINSGGAIEQLNFYIQDIISKTDIIIKKNFNKIKLKYPNINEEDIRIISSYTLESSFNTNFSPYKLLNTNLVSENRQEGINNISKYLYIFLNSLRKLQRYYPNSNQKFLYRCLKGNVAINNDIFNPKIVPYIAGNTKIFWGFTSTTCYAKTAYDFLNKEINNNKSGTIFTLSGSIWGYDISLFNYYGENEILLEPERKFIVEEVLPPINGIIHIRCIFQDTPLVLSNLYNNIFIIDKNINYEPDIIMGKSTMAPLKIKKAFLNAKGRMDDYHYEQDKILKADAPSINAIDHNDNKQIVNKFKGDGTMDPLKIKKAFLNTKNYKDDNHYEPDIII